MQRRPYHRAYILGTCTPVAWTGAKSALLQRPRPPPQWPPLKASPASWPPCWLAWLHSDRPSPAAGASCPFQSARESLGLRHEHPLRSRPATQHVRNAPNKKRARACSRQTIPILRTRGAAMALRHSRHHGLSALTCFAGVTNSPSMAAHVRHTRAAASRVIHSLGAAVGGLSTPPQ